MADQQQSDHDLLIKISQQVETMNQTYNRVLAEMASINSRVIALEVKDRGDSERIGSIVEAVKGSNNNSTRIAEAHTRLDNLVEDVNDLKSKSNRNDALNAIFAGVSGVIGFFFGNK